MRLPLLLAALLAAAPAPAALLREDAAAAAARAARLERPWAEGWPAYEEAWRRKCGGEFVAPRGCFLAEEDVPSIASPRPGRVLLFRGGDEEKLVRARVSVWASNEDGRALCGSDCDYAGLSVGLRRLGLGLVGAPLEWLTFAYDLARGWGVTEAGTGRFTPLADVPPPSDDSRFASVMEVYARLHVLNVGPYYGLDWARSLDPMVSFSSDPRKAADYAYPSLIVVSVPAEDVLRSPSACGAETPAFGRFLDVHACGADSYEHESEYDAFLAVDGELLVDALRRGP